MKIRGKPPGNPLGADAWRLAPRDIVDIRLRVAGGEKKATLAREYNVSEATVYYHCKSGKDVLREPYTIAIARACEARRKGNHAEAARQLRAAADVLDAPPAKAAA